MRKSFDIDPDAFLPLDKSWAIRMGILDLLNGSQQIIHFLEDESTLNEDLEALLKAAHQWGLEKVFVGESGTLLRFLQFSAWKNGLRKTFVRSGTLVDREIHHQEEIVHWTQEKLLTLDHGTSQWASAAVLNGDGERLPNAPFKLQVTYEAVDHWHQARENGIPWIGRLDETIARQAHTFLEIMNGVKASFIPRQAEDYCFARIFGFISQEEGLRHWPNLQGHESNRILAMEEVITQIEKGAPISSKDHRVVQAAAMKVRFDQTSATFQNPEAVNKTWPRFWEFMNQF